MESGVIFYAASYFALPGALLNWLSYLYIYGRPLCCEYPLTNWFYREFLDLTTNSWIAFRINMLSHIMRFSEKNTQHKNELQMEKIRPVNGIF